MRIKHKPSDFVVEEISKVKLQEKGDFAIFKVTKQGLTTFQAEKILSTKFEVPFKQIGFAGMKDKHGLTSQFFSVENLKTTPVSFKEERMNAEFVGFSNGKIEGGMLEGNNFKIIVRDVPKSWLDYLESNVELVSKGVPNYFDSQRFGSLRGNSDFLAKDILKGDYEAAIKKVLLATKKRVKTNVKQLKRFVKDNWGKWGLCSKQVELLGLQKTSQGNIIIHLANNSSDYKGAFQKLFSSIRQFYFSAYQSYIWNETLKQLFNVDKIDCFEIPYDAGKLSFPKSEINNLEVPLVSGDLRCDKKIKIAILEVLKKEGFSLTDFFTNEYIFVDRLRNSVVAPKNLSVNVEEDDLFEGNYKVELEFFLPKGSYATIIIKALFAY